MVLECEQLELRLAYRQCLRLYSPSGASLECVSGCIWITHDRQREDHIVRAGECLPLDARGITVVSAMKDSRLRLLCR